MNVSANESAKTLLILGDSLSAGYGLDAGEGWVDLLRQRLSSTHPGYRVANASISGDTTQGGLSRLPAALQREQPDIVILELGANDGLRGFAPTLMRNNLAQMITLSQQAGAEVLLLGIDLPANYGPVYREKFRNVFHELASEYQLAFMPFFLEGVAETRDLMQADGLHPAAAAQPRILENVWSVLEAMLAKP